MPYHHGIRVTEVNEAARAISTVATATIGLVSVADDADADFFPLDTPVLVDDIAAAIGKAGDDGKLAASLEAREMGPVGLGLILLWPVLVGLVVGFLAPPIVRRWRRRWTLATGTTGGIISTRGIEPFQFDYPARIRV